jgi:hypothetical protein
MGRSDEPLAAAVGEDERKKLMTLLVGETFFVENPIKIGK